MDLSNNTIERICKIFGHLDALEKQGIDFVSSKELAGAIGATEDTIRKDISLLEAPGYTRKGYEVKSFKKVLGQKFQLSQKRKACLVGLGRLGTALMDYENFQENGFEIIAGFDRSVNKIERIRTSIDVFPVSRLAEIVQARDIELGIIAVPAESAQDIADQLAKAGVKGVLNFSPVKVNVPETIIHLDMDFTNALRFIAARFIMNKT